MDKKKQTQNQRDLAKRLKEQREKTLKIIKKHQKKKKK